MLTKFSCDLDLWPFDHKMYRYLPLTILHLCVTYERCTLKTNQVIVSEPKWWQILVVTLTFDLLTQKCIGIFVSPSCIYVWNMKTVHWKLLKLSCQNQSVDRHRHVNSTAFGGSLPLFECIFRLPIYNPDLPLFVQSPPFQSLGVVHTFRLRLGHWLQPL